MSTTIVLFEDVDPFKNLNFPITFRAQVDYGSVRQWDVDSYEAQGAEGGWVEIRRGHPLWSVMDGFTTSDAGFERIESQITRELEEDPSYGWGLRRFSQAAE